MIGYCCKVHMYGLLLILLFSSSSLADLQAQINKGARGAASHLCLGCFDGPYTVFTDS